MAALEEIGANHQATPSQVTLSWLISFHGETVVAIPGASRKRHAEENAEAMRLRLAESELGQIDEAARRFM